MSLLDFLSVRKRVSRRRAVLESHPNFELFVQRIKPVADWGDFVLPEDGRQILRQISVHMRWPAMLYERWRFSATCAGNKGNSVLFVGGSSRDRTMAAEILATHLRVDLYRIDLGAVVSKYSGETEKNLRFIFDAAEDGGVILFFDEADALFGKRSEVNDNYDCHTNIVVSYLLERIERFRGLVIVATNRRTNLDETFTRRLRYLVEFPDPNSA